MSKAYCSLLWRRMLLAFWEINPEMKTVHTRMTIRLVREKYFTSRKGLIASG